VAGHRVGCVVEDVAAAGAAHPVGEWRPCRRPRLHVMATLATGGVPAAAALSRRGLRQVVKRGWRVQHPARGDGARHCLCCDAWFGACPFPSRPCREYWAARQRARGLVDGGTMAVSWAMDAGAAGKRSRGWHGTDWVAPVYCSMECGRRRNHMRTYNTVSLRARGSGMRLWGSLVDFG